MSTAMSGVTQQVLLLDLKDSPDAIAAYEAAHKRIWPEVAAHLRRHGVLDMTIHRLGTRLVMVMQTDDARFDAARMAQDQALIPILSEWEAQMGQYQAPTPWTPEGQKWTRAACIFRLADQPDPPDQPEQT
ncbi:L-rhamnose mutarotase [Amphibiibacter pelophylacis]|uniref:L-rhamnose mutarotase n=1 Tax=Amphibiibacter pelophylacis TaxID=1799477 RepID=A0ACC6P1S6_9BURK